VNLPEILDNLKNYLGTGTITSRSETRHTEGTTFEASCYTDPLALEHLTGSLAESIRFFGDWEAPVQLRFTTKFDNVEPLLTLPHHHRTRVRFSLNAEQVARNFEGGTSSLIARLAAMRRMALAGYPIGMTVAPIMHFDGWEQAYTDLFQRVSEALKDVPMLDLTAELITHRFTPTSKDVLLDWYPRTPLDMDESNRSQKRTKFGSVKYVYPAGPMRNMRQHMENALHQYLPGARILYWT
jgi:spore photoproduct lyase